jgi:hypothetical protein
MKISELIKELKHIKKIAGSDVYCGRLLMQYGGSIKFNTLTGVYVGNINKLLSNQHELPEKYIALEFNFE